jgi:NAD(P)-dependent dehydrogenase (short-subunit alcohol dehydrogenase family)
MVKRRKGRIVWISSREGLNTNPFPGIYSVSKHAVEATAETMSLELQEFGIEVATVNPGLSLTVRQTRQDGAQHAATTYHLDSIRDVSPVCKFCLRIRSLGLASLPLFSSESREDPERACSGWLHPPRGEMAEVRVSRTHRRP